MYSTKQYTKAGLQRHSHDDACSTTHSICQSIAHHLELLASQAAASWQACFPYQVPVVLTAWHAHKGSCCCILLTCIMQQHHLRAAQDHST